MAAGSFQFETSDGQRFQVRNVQADHVDKSEAKPEEPDLDVAFLEWLSHIHHDTTLFENEVKNGSDAELKTYAKDSITAGNGHLKEARELLGELQK